MHREGFHWTHGHAGVVTALGAEVGNLYSRNQHEDPYPRGFRPDPSLVFKGTRYFAEPTASAPDVVSDHPGLWSRSRSHNQGTFLSLIVIAICTNNSFSNARSDKHISKYIFPTDIYNL